MTWSPFFRLVTPLPISTPTPAPSWPRIDGNRPSGSAPDRVNSSVWQMPVALTSTRTSPSRGPSRSTVSMLSFSPALRATAARVFISSSHRALGPDLSALPVGGNPDTFPHHRRQCRIFERIQWMCDTVAAYHRHMGRQDVDDQFKMRKAMPNLAGTAPVGCYRRLGQGFGHGP